MLLRSLPDHIVLSIMGCLHTGPGGGYQNHAMLDFNFQIAEVLGFRAEIEESAAS